MVCSTFPCRVLIMNNIINIDLAVLDMKKCASVSHLQEISEEFPDDYQGEYPVMMDGVLHFISRSFMLIS